MTMTHLKHVSALVVDDNDHSRRLLKEVLASTGMSVRDTADPNYVLSFLETCPVDLVVTDYEMKPISGIQLTQRIRSHRHPLVRGCGVLMVTGYADRKHVLEAARVGIDGLISKPFTVGMVLERTMFVLSRAAARNAEPEGYRGQKAAAGGFVGLDD